MTTRDMDDIFPDSATIPSPLLDARATRLIDIHIYHLPPGEDTQSVESTLHVTEEAPPPLPDTQQEQSEPIRRRLPHKVSLFVLALIALFLLVVITGSLTSFFLFTPIVTITLIPESKHVQATGAIAVVPGIADSTSNQIPGRILSSLTMSQIQTVAATGRTQQAAQPGRGTITFYNAALYPQSIAAGTLLTGSDGIQAATDHGVTVPAVNYPTLGVATVTAHAIQPGVAGNIKAGDIYGSCCLLNISAVNSAFRGGQEAETYQSVSKQDIDTAVSSLKAQLMQAAIAALRAYPKNLWV